MTELRKRLNTAKVLTKVELKNRYHVVYMVEGGDEKTGFHTRFEIYYWRVILFGLCNAPAIFQSMMDNIFHDLLDNRIIVYLDEILIYTEDVDKHILLVHEVPSY